MSERTLVAGAEAALPTTTGTGTSFSEATVVRLINNSGTARLVTVVEERGGTVVGSFTMPGNTVEFLQKKNAHCIFAGDATVLGAKVGFTG